MHFFLSEQGDMRKVSKSDKSRADQLVRDGGKALRQRSIELNKYDVTLEQSPDKFFSASNNNGSGTVSLNGTQPVLRLLRRRG